MNRMKVEKIQTNSVKYRSFLLEIVVLIKMNFGLKLLKIRISLLPGRFLIVEV